MVGSGALEFVPVADIELDCENPRIRKFLEMYPEKPSAERIFLALSAAGGDENESSTTFEKLRQSILTSGGIIHPVILNRRADGSLICIEGNTRVALYQNFLEEKVAGNWTRIPSLVHDQMDENQADAIRLQVHLVGTRPWDPYSKAKYLYQLRTQARLPFQQIVDFCGGRQKEVLESINAFSDMERHYKPIVDEGNYDTTRFSGYVELQKPGVKEAIVTAGFDLTDFAHWIHDRRLYPMHYVRQLHRILTNPKAKEIFLKKNAAEAMKAIDRPDLDKALIDATIDQLSQALRSKIYALPFLEADRLRRDSDSDLALNLSETLTALSVLLGSGDDGERLS